MRDEYPRRPVEIDAPRRLEAGRLVRERPEAAECLPARRGQIAADKGFDPLLEIVDSRIRVRPGIAQRSRIELANRAANVRQLEQPRPFGHEQTNSELDRRHMLDQPQPIAQRTYTYLRGLGIGEE